MMNALHCTGRCIPLAILVMAPVIAQPAHAEDVVLRRGGLPPLTGTATVLDDHGVTMRSATGATQVIPWDRVRDVQLDRADPLLESRLRTAEQLWRARSRLQRGDATLAEPLFERLFAHYRGQTHETALIVAEGLLRCRLARMAHEAALPAGLEVMRLRRAGIDTAAFSMQPKLFDDATGLCTHLPPVWIDDRSARAVERELADYDAGDDDVLEAIASEYRRSLRQHLQLDRESGTEEPQPAQTSTHDGVKLLRLMNDVRSPRRETSVSARNRLAGRMNTLPIWAQAWSRFVLGESLCHDRQVEAQLQGLVHLLHLPAGGRFRNESYLTGMALMTAADALQRLNDQHGAEALRLELSARYPGHPAIRRSASLAQGTVYKD